MNWENYAIFWEYDHVLPIPSFDLRDEDERKKCFNFINIRPLKIKENKSKLNKINNLI